MKTYKEFMSEWQWTMRLPQRGEVHISPPRREKHMAIREGVGG
jgi:hypothetical protein